MSKKQKDTPWKPIGVIAILVTILSTSMHLLGLPSCDGLAKAAALEKTDAKLDQLLIAVQENTIHIAVNATHISILNERESTRTCE
jgi:hypothetical protein